MFWRHGLDSDMNVMGTYAAFARGNQQACGEFLPAIGGGGKGRKRPGWAERPARQWKHAATRSRIEKGLKLALVSGLTRTSNHIMAVLEAFQSG